MTAEGLRAWMAPLKELLAARRIALARSSDAQRTVPPSIAVDETDDEPDASSQNAVAQLDDSGNGRVQRAGEGAAGTNQCPARALEVTP